MQSLSSSVFQPPGVLGAMKAVEHEHSWGLWLTGGGRELLRALQELQEAAAAPSGSISYHTDLLKTAPSRNTRGARLAEAVGPC